MAPVAQEEAIRGSPAGYGAGRFFRIVPKVDIKFQLSEFRVEFVVQTSPTLGVSGCRPFDHVLLITQIGKIFADRCVPWSRLDPPHQLR